MLARRRLPDRTSRCFPARIYQNRDLHLVLRGEFLDGLDLVAVDKPTWPADRAAIEDRKRRGSKVNRSPRFGGRAMLPRMSAALIVPTLAAGSFRLRPFSVTDVDAVREASGDPYIPLITTVPAVFTEDEGRQFIERQWDRAGRGTGYSFAIADGATGHAVGQIGLWLKDLSDGRASIGYWVIRSARGRQAAGTALQALAQWAFHDLQIPRLHLYVEPWNTASIMTAERAGFVREALMRSWQEVGGTRRDMYMYARLPGDPVPSTF